MHAAALCSIRSHVQVHGDERHAGHEHVESPSKKNGLSGLHDDGL